MSSSSRSNLLLVNVPLTKTLRKSFQPFTTSSRRSLLVPIDERTPPSSMACTICLKQDKLRRGVDFFVAQQNIVNNICSSTLISLSGNECNSARKNSQISLVDCSLMSSCTTMSMTTSATDSSNSLKNCSYC